MIKYHRTSDNIIAELTDMHFIMNESQDALDLMAEIGNHKCNRLIIREYNLNSNFFDLKTGFAGEILQKFSNYDVKLAIIGDFKKFNSKSLQDFIRECNRRNLILFSEDLKTALSKLTKK